MGLEPAARMGAASGCVLCGGPMQPLFAKRGHNLARCSGCGLVSLDPIPDGTAVGAHHDASYRDGRYAAFAAAEDVRAAIARDRFARVRPQAPAGPWLDVGCSTGAFVAVAAAAGLDAEGIELSATAVAEARRRGLAVTQASAETFTAGRRFAAVTAFDVIEHLPDPAAFVRRVKSLLLPAGLLALTLPDFASPTARLLGRRWFYCAPPDHVHYFTPATIRRLLADAGFADVAVRPITKPLTLDYAAGQLALESSPLGRVARAVLAITPRPLRRRPLPLPLGEMLVLGRAG